MLRVFWQTTRIGVKPARTARLPSWPWLRRTNFSTVSPSAITSGSRLSFASTQIRLPPRRLPAVCSAASLASRNGWNQPKASRFCKGA